MDREIVLEEERGEAKAGRQKDRHLNGQTHTNRQTASFYKVYWHDWFVQYLVP